MIQNLQGVAAKKAANSYFTYDVLRELELMGKELALLGYGENPELLGAVLKKIKAFVSKIAKSPLSAQVPGGTVAYTPAARAVVPVALPASPSKLPLYLAIGGGALVVLLLATRR